MTDNDIIGLSITVFIGAFLVIISLFLFAGKGSFLLAGYNTASKKEKEKYDEKALCKFMGKILLPIGLATPLVSIGGIYKIFWLPFVYTVVLISLALFAVIYCNTGNRFKK